MAKFCATEDDQSSVLVSPSEPDDYIVDDDFVLSDVHATGHHHTQAQSVQSCFAYRLPLASHNATAALPSRNAFLGQPAKATCDKDGDLIVTRNSKIRRCGESKLNSCDRIMCIQHAMSTSLIDVGLQVWIGSLLLADFVLHKYNAGFNLIGVQLLYLCSIFDLFLSLLSRNRFCAILISSHPCSTATILGHHVVELGGGTGFVSLVARAALPDPSTVIFCTDIGDNVLANCTRNSAANELPILVRTLDWMDRTTWMQPAPCRASPLTPPLNSDMAFAWTPTDYLKLQTQPICFLAADVIYDCDLTDAFADCIALLLGANICLLTHTNNHTTFLSPHYLYARLPFHRTIWRQGHLAGSFHVLGKTHQLYSGAFASP